MTELVQRGHKITVLTGLPNYPDGDIFPEFRARPQDFMNFSGAEVLRVPLIRRGSSKIRLALNYISFAFSASIIGLWKLRGREFDAIFTCQLSPATVGIPGVCISICQARADDFLGIGSLAGISARRQRDTLAYCAKVGREYDDVHL
ncbi:MAG: hypothetical protein V9G23_01530 [Giesbergeria sp.]